LRRVSILDTTLRDGDQAAGFSFSGKDKLAMLRALALSGIDVIETGFPLSSGIDFEFCRSAALELSGAQERPVSAVMCRAGQKDISESAKVFEGGIPGVLHISLPVSRIHIKAKLRKSEAEILEMAAEAVSFAAGLVPKVELGAEDAFRADRDFLLDYCEAALQAGAAVINIADTLGAASPPQVRSLVEFLIAGIPALDPSAGGAALSIHCHNDLGLACANTLAALEAGCAQAELTLAGMGERAGNAALEEVCAALAVTKSGLYTGLRPEKLPALLRLAEEASDGAFSPMKPLSGWNVRSHSSGIHLHGLTKDPRTYSLPALEPWAAAKERIVLSRHSGRAGIALFARRCCSLSLDAETIDKIAAEIKRSEGLTGITEFLCMLFDAGGRPGVPAPLICGSFSAVFRSSPELHVEIEGALYVHGGKEEERRFCGAGESEAAAVLDALRKAGFTAPEFFRISLAGAGGSVRLYAETGFPSGRTYAVERSGTSPARLLFLCALDALNAEALQTVGLQGNAGL
jgi:2-isopropylmalate synthase